MEAGTEVRELGTSAGLPLGRCVNSGGKNARKMCSQEKRKSTAPLADEVSQVNSRLCSIQAGVHFFV